MTMAILPDSPAAIVLQGCVIQWNRLAAASVLTARRGAARRGEFDNSPHYSLETSRPCGATFQATVKPIVPRQGAYGRGGARRSSIRDSPCSRTAFHDPRTANSLPPSRPPVFTRVGTQMSGRADKTHYNGRK